MAVIGDYSNRLTIVARQHALNRAAPVRLEGNPLANPELEHVRVGADVLQQTKALDDPMVEVDQFGFRQPINVDHHEPSPSALNGVSTLQRPAGMRKPRNAQAALVMTVPAQERLRQGQGDHVRDEQAPCPAPDLTAYAIGWAVADT